MPKNITFSRFLFSLIINGFTFFGIIVLKWNFFIIIYLYWAEEIIRIIFKFIGNKIEYRDSLISELEFKLERKAIVRMLVIMGIYFLFIAFMRVFFYS